VIKIAFNTTPNVAIKFSRKLNPKFIPDIIRFSVGEEVWSDNSFSVEIEEILINETLYCHMVYFGNLAKVIVSKTFKLIIS
jgi:hypothetical protein